MDYTKKGFTLIELIIVIAIIGVLASVLVVALNPIEQSNKSRDVAAKAALKSIHDLAIRFYYKTGYMPWCDSTALNTCNAISLTNDADGVPIGNALLDDMATNLTAEKETPSDFRNNLSGTLKEDIIISTTDSHDNFTLCFNPKSATYEADSTNVWTNAVGSADTCVQDNDPGGGAPLDDCFICVKGS